MHGYIEYSMNIPLFSFLMMSLYVAFYDGHEIAGWAERIGLRLRRWHVTVRLPIGMQLSPRGVAFLDALDPLKMVAYMPGTEPVWAASRYDGSVVAPSRAIYSRSLGAWVFGWVPGVVRKMMERCIEPSPVEEEEEPVPAQSAGRKRR